MDASFTRKLEERNSTFLPGGRMRPETTPITSAAGRSSALIAIAQLMVVLDATIVNIALPERAGGPRLLQRLPPVDRHRLRAGVRLAAAARRPARRPLRPQVGLHRRPARLRRRLRDRRRRAALRRARRRARAPRACSARCSRRLRSRCSTTTFSDPAERGKAFGIFGAIAGGGAAVGLLLGGILTEWLSWRWCLYVNLLFAVPTAIAALRLLVNAAQRDRPRARPPGRAAPRPRACSRSSTASRTPRRTPGGTR